MTEFEAIRQYGWLTFLVYFALREVWPWFRDKAWPKRRAAQDRETRRVQLLEERQIIAVEMISTAVQEMAKANVATNERLAQLLNVHEKHDQLTRDAINNMYQRTGREPLLKKDKRE